MMNSLAAIIKEKIQEIVDRSGGTRQYLLPSEKRELNEFIEKTTSEYYDKMLKDMQKQNNVSRRQFLKETNKYIKNTNQLNKSYVKVSLIREERIKKDLLLVQSRLKKESKKVARKHISGLAKEVNKQGDYKKAAKIIANRLKAQNIVAMKYESGRTLSVDAYNNMVGRTYLSKSRVDAVNDFMDEEELDLFQVSVHGGARDACYPWQGKIYSRSGKSGTFKGFEGVEYEYHDIGDTTYLDAAGLFGINCRHYPIPVMPKTFKDLISKNIPSPAQNTMQVKARAKQMARRRR